MKLKILYEKLYDRIFSIAFFRMFLKIPGLEKLLAYDVISYLFFGAMTTVVNIVTTAFFNRLAGENYTEKILFTLFGFDVKWIYAVQAIAWIVSVSFAYVTNKLFVFESATRRFSAVLRELVSFFGARILSFLLFEELLFGVLEKLLERSVASQTAFWIAKIVSGVIVIVFNYIASKLVIFRKKGENQ